MSRTPEQLALRRERWTIVFANVGHVLTHLVTILYATAVLHLPAEFGLSYGEMLGFASLGLVLYGVAALPSGWLGDRWSQVGMMTLFFLGVGVAAVMVGLARTAGQLFVGLSLIGLFASIYHPVGIAWLIAHTRRQGITMGVNGLFGGLGSAIAAPFTGIMIDYASWRLAFILPGALSMLAALWMWSAWRRGLLADASADRATQSRPAPGAQGRVFVLLTLTMACAGFVYAGITHTMPKLFEHGLEGPLVSSYTEIGFYVGAAIALSSLSSVLGGWLADRYSPGTTYAAFWLLTTVPLFFIADRVGTPLLLLVVLALSFNTGFAAAENILVARYTPFKWRSLAYGSKFVLALGVGGLTVQLAGSLFDAAGDFDQLYFFMACSAVAASVASMLLPFEKNK